MRFFYFITVALLVFAEEPSAFEPVGEKAMERAIIENRKNIQNTQKDIFKLQTEVSNIKQSLDGFKSVIEGEMSKIRNSKKDSGESEKKVSDLNDSFQKILAEHDKSIKKIIETIEENKKIQDQNFNKINSLLKELGKSMEVQTKKEIEASKKDEVKKVEEKKDDFSQKDKDELYKEALSDFNSKKLPEAQKKFEYLGQIAHKPATTNYFLGEIAFSQKRYSEAIFFYKKSVTIYDKSSFMPTLLLHTAQSFEKTKDQANAKKFYSMLLDAYPDSKEAKTVKVD